MTGSRVVRRRSLLLLGFGALGTLALPGGAAGTTARVGDIGFLVPDDFTPVEPGRDGWQWRAVRSGGSALPAAAVLARADLDSTDAEEMLGLVLAGSAAGQLPGLTVLGSRGVTLPDGSPAVRTRIRYSPEADLDYSGDLLVLPAVEPPSALLAVVGDDSLTAGTVDAILESVRR